MERTNFAAYALAGLAALLTAGVCQATPYHVSIDTSSVGGVSVGLAFDFIDGGTPSNTVSISNFSTDGTLGAASTVGGVTGSLPSGFTLDDSDFFNEYFQSVSSATTLSFDFDPTANAPDAGSLPDTFSFFLIDDLTGLPLFDTTDPTGAGALFAFEIDGNGLLSVYNAAGTNVAVTWSVAAVENNNPVPEPSTLLLLGSGWLGAAFLRRRQKAVASSEV